MSVRTGEISNQEVGQEDLSVPASREWEYCSVEEKRFVSEEISDTKNIYRFRSVQIHEVQVPGYRGKFDWRLLQPVWLTISFGSLCFLTHFKIGSTSSSIVDFIEDSSRARTGNICPVNGDSSKLFFSDRYVIEIVSHNVMQKIC